VEHLEKELAKKRVELEEVQKTMKKSAKEEKGSA